MKRTTVMLPERTYAEMEEFARRDGVPTAHLVRAAMEQYVTAREERESLGHRSLPAFVGTIDSAEMIDAADIEDHLEATWPDVIEADRDDARAADRTESRAGRC